MATLAVVALLVWGIAAATNGSGPAATDQTSSATPPSEPTQPPEDEVPPPVPEQEPEPLPEGEADVVIVVSEWNSDDDAIEVSGYVGNVVEEDGRCTVTAEGPTTADASQMARANVSTTSCGLVTVDGTNLA